MSWRTGVVAAALLMAAGCQSLSYYTQAIGGHLRVMAHARPIGDWLADPSLDPLYAPERPKDLPPPAETAAFSLSADGTKESGEQQGPEDARRQQLTFGTGARAAL